MTRKDSDDIKRKLEYKLYIAKESPDTKFDLTDCELKEVPAGVFITCKIQQKEALLLSQNRLSKLVEAGGKSKLDHLRYLRLLDLHSNSLTALPKDIGCLQGLQILNVENNQLTSLPESIGKLRHLQTLNVKSNKLKVLSSELGQLSSLRLLDISDNPNLKQLPRELAKVRTLENVILSPASMKYPSRDICEGGTQMIMQFLCKDNGIEYHPPSHFTLDVLEGPRAGNFDIPSSKSMTDLDNEHHSVTTYERLKDERRQRILSLERDLTDNLEAHSQLAAKANQNKAAILDQMAEEENHILSDLAALQWQRDKGKKELVHSLCEAEQSAGRLVEELGVFRDRERKREAALEELERERMEQERIFEVAKEEADSLRRNEILLAMQLCLSESSALDRLVQTHLEQQDEVRIRAQRAITCEAGLVDQVLSKHLDEQMDVVNKVAREEELQKEAFSCLQIEKDVRSQRIAQQMALISLELISLSRVEVDRREKRKAGETEVLNERRAALIQFMEQLIAEREKRRKQLVAIVSEMENQKDQSQEDYWLIQYQRLMDRKPVSLMHKEHKLESAVCEILEEADAFDYLPQFQKHRITIETLAQITDEDLIQIGVDALGIRRAILRCVQQYNDCQPQKKTKMDDALPVCFLNPINPCKPSPPGTLPTEPQPSPASAPDSSDETAVSPASAPDLVAKVEMECCICMEKQCEVLFMKCGHICCCMTCASTMALCPLCRSPIEQRVLLDRLVASWQNPLSTTSSPAPPPDRVARSSAPPGDRTTTSTWNQFSDIRPR